jgi:hypothetical protein
MPLACYINLFPVTLKMLLPNAMDASSYLFKFLFSTNTRFQPLPFPVKSHFLCPNLGNFNLAVKTIVMMDKAIDIMNVARNEEA